MPIDDGHAISYTALPKGIPVFSADEIEIGTVREVLDNVRERIFDGIVMETNDGARLFVDAPEVARTAERAVTLHITADQVGDLEPYKPSRGKPAGGFMSRLFGRQG